jgi:hypothetical protein
MMSGRVILSGRVNVEADTFLDRDYDQTAAHAGGWRRMLGAPLLKDGAPIGAIVLAWPDPGATPQRQIDLPTRRPGDRVETRLLNGPGKH